jgi:outer membrane protein TolC
MADLDRASKSFQTDQELLSLEEETFESLERQYREGKVSYLDLTEARNSFLDARTRFFTSYFETLRSLAQYRYLEGKISDGFDAE